MKPEDFGQVKTVQLHHFSDASEQGYGTVSYIRFIDNLGKIHVTLVMGKSRVSPLKRMTIPRLELTAATLAVRVDQMLRSELQLNLEESIFWTDSQSVLKYIYNQNKRFHTFVANRLAVIHDLSKEDQWKYVDSKQNPADDASRGLNIESLLKSKRWLQGPEFLKNEESQWPQNPDEASQNYISLDDPEVKKDAVVNIMIIDVENPVSKLIEYYSDWISLKKTVAWILKIKTLLLEITKRKKINSGLLLGKDKPLKERAEALKVAFNGNLTLEDMENAERAILVFKQHQHFKQDIALLERGKPCMKDSSILKMDPMLNQGILRVGGRINRSAMPVSIKNPIILPKKSHISEIILKHIHIQIGHSGRNHILSKLGQKYWMPSANSLAREISIRNCVFCRRMQSKVGEQKMADLPQDRVIPDLPPFTSVGMDYFGPFEVKRGRTTVKRWGVIFTCLTSRAVHLEVASSLDTNSCINAIRRFLYRRGTVQIIRSDQGTNFTGAQKELQQTWEELNHDKIGRNHLQDGIKWIFNPASGAHHGGV